MKKSLIIALLMAGTAPAVGQEYVTGQEAFAARDWAAAEAIWRSEAAAGSPDAMLGLGNILDFGLAGAPDPDAAFSQYLAAAELGLPEAAFNVAVMFDSGVGTDADPRLAAAWYAFAALDGFARAQFNLGQIFAQGDGIPQNPQLADFWLERAEASVPAATQIRATLEPAPGADLVAPVPLHLVLRQTDGAVQARAAWASSPGPADALYRVEIMDGAGSARNSAASIETTVSAVAMQLPTLPDDPFWRVLYLTDTDYAASQWQALDGTLLDLPDPAVVRFEFFAEDRRGRGYAERVGASLSRSGTEVHYDLTRTELDASAVSYRYASDAGLAAQILDFLPGLDGSQPSQNLASGLAPGAVRVRIAFDPAGG